jgi:hypothetical protein
LAARPKSKFSILICRISVRSSKSICGRPPRERDFHRQWRRKPARFRLDNRHDLQDRRKPSIHPDEEPAVVICEPSPALQLTTQDDKLMSEHRILRLKPLFDLNGEASTARTNRISAIIAPTYPILSLNKP